MTSRSITKISTRDMCLIALFTAILAAMAQVSVPMPFGVPFTMQTFAVPLAAVVLGAKKGTAVTIVYILLGAVGVPVFTGFGGGFSRIIGQWGGFILSYPIFAFIVGYCADKGKKPTLAIGLAVGSLINLTMGMVQYGFVSGVTLTTAFLTAFAPFVLLEAVKMTMVFLCGFRIRKAVSK